MALSTYGWRSVCVCNFWEDYKLKEKRRRFLKRINEAILSCFSFSHFFLYKRIYICDKIEYFVNTQSDATDLIPERIQIPIPMNIQTYENVQ